MIADISIIFILILVNGLFAMSEIAIVSSRRVRLTQMAEQGRTGAAAALKLGSEPTRFLSTVQVGITSIGIMSGAVGEATVAVRLKNGLETMPVVAPYAETVAFVVMVVGLTYVSLIAGELVPKRLALTRPELFAAVLARPMQLLAAAVRPLVYFLSASTDGVLRLLRVPHVKEPAVTVEEFKVLMEQGTEEGVFDKTEQELVGNILRLDERRVGAIMTPRSEIVFLDTRAPFDVNRGTLTECPHTVVPLCDGGLDRVVGFVKSTDVVVPLLRGEAVDLLRVASPALFVPATTTSMRLLEQFRRAHLPVALIVDEHGDVDGLVSLADVVEAIVGDLPTAPGEEPMVVARPDGSWLIDGALDLDSARRVLQAESLARDAGEQVHTMGGLAMLALGRVPKTGDVFEEGALRFEIVDMDGNRVDRLLVSRIQGPSDAASTPAEE